MADLDQIVKKYYPQQLEKTKFKNFTHHMFTPYFQKSTQKFHFLKLLEMPAHLHFSEGIAQVVKKKYGDVLLDAEIHVVDRMFHSMTYLVISKQNIISLQKLLEVKLICKEYIGQEFFLQLLSFLLNLNQLFLTQKLPQVNPSQIGVKEDGSMCICDVGLYFKSEEELNLKKKKPKEANHFITEFMQQLCKYQQIADKTEEDQLRELFGNMNQNSFNLLIKILKGELTIFQIDRQLSNVRSKIQDDSTTVTASFIEGRSTGSFGKRSFDSKRSSSVHLQKIKKINPVIKVILIFILLGMLVTGGYYLYLFFTRSTTCVQGFFLGDKKQCLSCSRGCLECIGVGENQCIRCSANMFLVIETEQSTVGCCQKQCRGTRIRDACLPYKN